MHVPRSRKEKKKKNKNKREIAVDRSFIRIPTNKMKDVTTTLLTADINMSYEELSDLCGINWRRMRDLIQEFQLVVLNQEKYTFIAHTLLCIQADKIDEINKKTFIQDISYYYPTLKQFYDQELDLLSILKDILQRPRTDKVKKNQLLRYFYHYTGETLQEIVKHLSLGKTFVLRFREDFIKVIEQGNNYDIKSFGLNCGLDQLTESAGGIIQSLKQIYFRLMNPSINQDLHEFHKTGYLKQGSIFNHLFVIDKNNARLEYLEQMLEKKRLEGETDFSLLEEKIKFIREETLAHLKAAQILSKGRFNIDSK